jgi:EAL domain-containing protein (putative c-di-GMP-specific phosphodiesterase class I)
LNRIELENKFMPLQHLVEYFNDRFGREHHSSFRPFILEDGDVSGLFGPIRISSVYTPLRETLKPASIIGHTAQISVVPYENQHLNTNDIDNLVIHPAGQATDFESIINFDRLCRTVHMLNYLPLAHFQGVLFLEVDPRHILGIKQDHGAYFEEVIIRCGLATKNVVILMAVNNQYARYHHELLKGLENYRRRGYQLALKFDYIGLENQSLELIAKLSPNYVSLSARHLDRLRDSTMLAKLHKLRSLISSTGGKSIMRQIDQKRPASLARNTNFDLVQGSYYEQPSALDIDAEAADIKTKVS